MQAQGFGGFEATVWGGLVAPKGPPAPIADRIDRDVDTVLAMPDVTTQLDPCGAEDSGGSRERFAQVIASEPAKWAKVVKDGNVEVETRRARGTALPAAVGAAPPARRFRGAAPGRPARTPPASGSAPLATLHRARREQGGADQRQRAGQRQWHRRCQLA